MATAVTNQFSANVTKDESVSGVDGARDMSAEINEKDNILQMVDSGFDEERVFESDQYQMAMEMLEDSKLKGNDMYEKLVTRLSAFYLNTEKIKANGGLNEQQQEVVRKSGFSQDYRVRLHKCLRELLIHIVNEKTMDVKLRQLRQTYEWFFRKLVAMGALSQQEIEAELAFLNPMSKNLQASMRNVIKQKVHSALCNTDAVDAYNKAMYEDPKYAQRTHHGHIQPTAIRINSYKHKTFGKKYTDAVEQVKQKDYELALMKKSKQEHGLMTAQLGSIYDVPTTAQSQSQDTQSTAAGSVRFSDTTGTFCQTEGAVFKPAFKSFYTDAEQQVKFETVNKFEGVSSYFSYYPTNDLREQKLEQVWFHFKNKQLADKRRDEETAAYVREWAQARGRMEAEIQRRKEHLNEATNFEEARGFVRTNWKTKNWNPNDDPTQEDSSTDSEDEETVYKDEKRDQVQNIGGSVISPSSKGGRNTVSESEDHDLTGSAVDARNASLDLTRQLSDSKTRKRMYQHRPQIIDITETQSEAATLPSVREQIDTLNAIKAYNKALKPARKVKDALPEIISTNVASRDRFVKDYKKGKINKERSYQQIGIVDGGEATPFNQDKYSLSAKQRAIQRASSQQRIDTIRTSYANLLGITPKKVENDMSLLPPATQPVPTFVDGFTRLREPVVLDNPFTPQKVESQISLSVYNRPSSMAARRPHTAYTAEDLVRKLPGWKPPVVKAVEGEEPVAQPATEVKREPILPDFALSKQFDFVSKNATDSMRQSQLEEIQSIRDYLAKPQEKRAEKDKANINIPLMKTFERAILMPSEVQDNLQTKRYPTYGEFLMVNPFPKKKKKKKGKKGKKR